MKRSDRNSFDQVSEDRCKVLDVGFDRKKLVCSREFVAELEGGWLYSIRGLGESAFRRQGVRKCRSKCC